MLRGQLVTPPVEDVGDLLDAPEPGGDAALALGVAQLGEELLVGDRAAVLDVLLPLRGDLAHQVAHREHEVDLGAVVGGQRLHRAADLAAGGGREDLVADDRCAGVSPHLLGQRVPAPDRLGLQASPRQRHQVQGGEEVGVVAVGGVEQAVVAQPLAIAEQHVLQVGGAGLGSADVQQDPGAHVPASCGPVRSCAPVGARSRSTARASTRSSAASPERVSPEAARARGRLTRPSTSPTTG